MSRIRSKDTAPEMAVRRFIHGLGYRYRLHVQSLPGRPDLVFGGLKKIVQIHGCFFHQHDGCKAAHVPLSRKRYWIPKLTKNKVRDAENERRLRELGWKVLTVWACEIDRDPTVLKRIRKFLSRR